MDMKDPDEMAEGREFPGRIELVELLPPSETPWGGPGRERLHLQIRPLDHTIDGEAGSGCYPMYIPDSSQKNSKWWLFKKALKDCGFDVSRIGPDGKGLLNQTFIWQRVSRKFFDEQERETTMLLPVKYLPNGWQPSQGQGVPAAPAAPPQPTPPASAPAAPAATYAPAPPPTGGGTAAVPPAPAQGQEMFQGHNFTELFRMLQAPEGLSSQQIYRWGDDHGIPRNVVYEYMQYLHSRNLLVNYGGEVYGVRAQQ